MVKRFNLELEFLAENKQLETNKLKLKCKNSYRASKERYSLRRRSEKSYVLAWGLVEPKQASNDQLEFPHIIENKR